MAGSTFLLWALVAGSAVAWGLRFTAGRAVLPPPAAVSAPAPVDPLSVARLLGSGPGPTAAAPSASSRFALQGVVADGDHGGAALIAIDGKPPKPYRVGATVDGDLVLQSVEARRASLGPAQGAPTLTLDLPRPVPGASTAAHPPTLPGPVGIPQPMPNPPAPLAGTAPVSPQVQPVPQVLQAPQATQVPQIQQVPQSPQATGIPPQMAPGVPHMQPGARSSARAGE